MAVQIEVSRQLGLHCARSTAHGETPMHEGALAKVFAGEVIERCGEAALDILGMQSALCAGAADSILGGSIEQKLRHPLMWVISVGTNEIQRNVIAQRGLGLPALTGTREAKWPVGDVCDGAFITSERYQQVWLFDRFAWTTSSGKMPTDRGLRQQCR